MMGEEESWRERETRRRKKREQAKRRVEVYLDRTINPPEFHLFVLSRSAANRQQMKGRRRGEGEGEGERGSGTSEGPHYSYMGNTQTTTDLQRGVISLI